MLRQAHSTTRTGARPRPSSTAGRGHAIPAGDSHTTARHRVLALREREPGLPQRNASYPHLFGLEYRPDHTGDDRTGTCSGPATARCETTSTTASARKG